MFIPFIIVGSAFLTIVISNNKCSPMPKVYEELGCLGKELDSNKCPTSYECPDFEKYDQSKCVYNGKEYNKGQKLIEGEHSCMAECTCAGVEGEKLSFKCAEIECPEDMDREMFENCSLKYELGKCCAQISCGKEVQNPSKCHYKGIDYVDGQLFHPTDAPCHKCVCNKNFDSSIDAVKNKNCQPIDCGIEIRYFREIQKRCAPIYYKTTGCCPIGFRCPSSNDEIISSNVPEDSSKHVCKYGNLTLRKGQMLNSLDKCVKCTCALPPLVECIRIC